MYYKCSAPECNWTHISQDEALKAWNKRDKALAAETRSDLARRITDELFGDASRLVCQDQGEYIARKGWSKKCMAIRIQEVIESYTSNASGKAE
jgi:hypothetical protein